MESAVVQLCVRLRILADQRDKLDQSLLIERDDAGERLWCELDATLAHISDLTSELANVPSQSAREVAAKADILATLLAPYLTDPKQTSIGVLQLAFTVAREAATSL